MAEPTKRVLLGELLVQSKVITPEQLGEILSSPREPGKKLGHMLLERGWVTEAQLTQMLSLQLSVPWVSLSHIDFSRQLLARVPREVAVQSCLIPIFVRHVKGQGETLYVAMDDPTNTAVLGEIASLAGLPCRPMIASASDIRSAIRLYYGEPASGPPTFDIGVPTAREGRARFEAAAAQPAPASVRSPKTPSKPPPPPQARAKAAAPQAAPPAEEPAPMTRRSAPPSEEIEPVSATPPSAAEPRSRGARLMSLTLLDGTQIQLPSQKQAAPEAAALEELLATLRQGGAVSEVGPVLAALLELLVRKGLVSERELLEELAKR